jgi:hypothetical protein
MQLRPVLPNLRLPEGIRGPSVANPRYPARNLGIIRSFMKRLPNLIFLGSLFGLLAGLLGERVQVLLQEQVGFASLALHFALEVISPLVGFCMLDLGRMICALFFFDQFWDRLGQ